MRVLEPGGYTAFRSNSNSNVLICLARGQVIFFITTVQILGKETGYFLGPTYVNQPAFKWWVATVGDVAAFFSLSTTAVKRDPKPQYVHFMTVSIDFDRVFVLSLLVHFRAKQIRKRYVRWI